MRYQKSIFKTEGGQPSLTGAGTLLLAYAERFVEKTVQVSLSGSDESAASVDTTTNFPVPVDHGDSLIASIAGDLDQELTIACTVAAKTAGNAPTYNVPNNATLTIPINGADQTITWLAADFPDNTVITLAQALAYFALKLTGISATDDGGSPKISTLRKGTAATIGVITGSAAVIFGFPGGVAAGTGNIANNLTGLTFTEFKTLAEAAFTGDTGVLVTAVGDDSTISTNNTGDDASIQIKASTLATKLGIDLDLHEGLTMSVTLEGTIDGDTWVELGGFTDSGFLLVPESIDQLRVVVADYTAGTITAMLGAFDPRVGA